MQHVNLSQALREVGGGSHTKQLDSTDCGGLRPASPWDSNANRQLSLAGRCGFPNAETIRVPSSAETDERPAPQFGFGGGSDLAGFFSPPEVFSRSASLVALGRGLNCIRPSLICSRPAARSCSSNCWTSSCTS